MKILSNDKLFYRPVVKRVEPEVVPETLYEKEIVVNV